MGGFSSFLDNYIVPPVAAAAAIVPPFPLYERKSALQCGRPVPTGVIASWMRSIGGSGIVGLSVGVQVILQKNLESFVTKEGEKPTVGAMAATTAAVAMGTSPLLAAFTGYAARLTMKEAISRFSPSVVALIGTRETGALGGWRASLVLREQMEELFGENVFTRSASALVGGCAGALVSHPVDTLLTRRIAGLRTSFLPVRLMKGASSRASAGAIFTLCFVEVSEILKKVNRAYIASQE